MALQVRSSARRAERRSAVIVGSVIFGCALLSAVLGGLGASSPPQAKPSREASDRFRFKVTDSDNDLPIPEVAVSLVYWQGKESVEEKKEIELKTDKNGIAEFPKVEAKKMVVTVSAKGYRPFWRWFRPNGLQELSRIRLQKWASTAFRERTHQ